MALSYSASPTVSKFFADRSFIKLIMGPVGGGKSTAALIELLNRSFNQAPASNGVRRTKHVILRNTAAQLRSTVKPLIDQWLVTNDSLPAPMGQWRVTDNTFEIKAKLADNTVVHTELVLVAADTPEDVRRLLSMECSSAWVEEAREVDEQVFAGLQGRVARFPNRNAGGVTYPGVICSTNPPIIGSFWHDLIVKPPKNTAIFIQPSALLPDGQINPEAENLQNLDADYYDNLIAANTDAWVDVYLRNNFGAGNYGHPVFKGTFKRSFHVSTDELKAVSAGLNPLVIGADNGLQGAIVVTQQDAKGRVNVLMEAFVPEDETMGYETFMDRIFMPKFTSKWPTFPREKVVFVVDPACFQRSQANERTVAQAIQQRGFVVMRASTNDPDRRIQAVETLLLRQIDGGPGFLIDPSCKHLQDAMDWGFRWKKTAGGVGATAVDKNHYSHICDATQYACLHYNLHVSGRVIDTRPKAREVMPRKFAYT